MFYHISSFSKSNYAEVTLEGRVENLRIYCLFGFGMWKRKHLTLNRFLFRINGRDKPTGSDRTFLIFYIFLKF